jgi:transposase-like protein
MKRKGPQKHSTEVIQAAITKYEGGARLSAIARELKVEKTTVKYWLDNASKFLPEDRKQSPVAARIHTRLTREVWDFIFAALKAARGKLDETPMRDLMVSIKTLYEMQAQFGALTGRGRVPEKVLEKSEEVRITVEKFLQKRDAGKAKSSLGGPAVQRPEEPAAAAQIIDVEADGAEGNGAT